jgi:hypothetical protein
MNVYDCLQLQNGYIDLQQTWSTYSLKPERDFRKPSLLMHVLSSSTGKGGFCILETKHDRRKSPKPKLCFDKQITVTTKTTKNCPGFLSPCEDFL